jgi:hypothetical protein
MPLAKFPGDGESGGTHSIHPGLTLRASRHGRRKSRRE